MILETKLQPPSLKPNTLRRERLLKLLKNNLERKLVLITGDAGYGKTTLLAQVMKEEDIPSVYYDLDKGDSDLVVFASYLVHGLEKLQKGLASRTKGLLEQGGEVGKNYELLFGTLINEIVEKRKEELFIILDDYHALPEDSLVHQGLDYFVDHLPDIVHVVIASRTVPPLPSLAKWRAKEDLYELSREGLKFTEEEVRSLLSEVYKVGLSEEELKRVSEQTEGWITGIRLILQAAGKDGKTVKGTLNGYLEANQPLFEYFANEILTNESLELQDFLRKSSILEVMTSVACDKIFGVEGSEELLKSLEKRNLFVSSVGKCEYKYHRLFRDFLQVQTKDESFRKALHLRAADYYQRKEQWEQAIEHYLEGGSPEWAGKAISRIGDDLEEGARFDTLRKWFAQIPREIVLKYPRLFLLLGAVFREQGRLEEEKALYDEAEQQVKGLRDPLSEANILLAQGKLLFAQGEYPEALRRFRKALRACLPEEVQKQTEILNSLGIVFSNLGEVEKARWYLRKTCRLSERAGARHNLVTAGYNLASLASQQGDLVEAHTRFQKLIELVGGRYQHKVGHLFGNAARTALDLGQEALAERILEAGRTLCRPYEDPWSLVPLHRNESYLWVQRGDLDRAEALLMKAMQEARRLRWANMEPILVRDLIRLYRYRGNPGKVEEALAPLVEKEDSFDVSSRVALRIEQGFHLASKGRMREAERVLDESLKLSRRFGLRTGLLFCRLAQAEVRRRAGKTREAVRCLGQVIRLAKREGYDGILARELRYLPALMAMAREGGLETSYLSSRPAFQAIWKSSGTDRIPGLRICLLGIPRVFIGAKEVSPVVWTRRKALELFVYFALHSGKPLTKEVLLETLWPRLSPRQATNAFHTTLLDLRKVLQRWTGKPRRTGELVIRAAGTYSLSPDFSVWVDAQAFEGLVKEAERQSEDAPAKALLAQAVALRQGSFCEGWFSSWVQEEARRFETRYRETLLMLGNLQRTGGETKESIVCFQKAIQMNPLDEEAYQLLMMALAQAGKRIELKAAYEQLQRVLNKELKVTPQPKTETLYSQLISRRPFS